MINQILSKKEVKTLLHFKSGTSLYTLEQKDETFPQRIRIGLRRVGYRADEIYSWLESRKVERREVA
ncbi:AlpA family phage regulatory protein [Gilliamella sp. B2923]|uniref:helix-turn-helix transcriptional regulator n=1 Tax=Gilliamella sp. B2923 TaxID=2818005 RepID=UPI00226AA1A4|nr:AlpA family phage regulatory protein [Gilliamella sp. B2923]MCX8616885.1 AlpA family phage regulatory protein [Gilliamella sp. B2923]